MRHVATYGRDIAHVHEFQSRLEAFAAADAEIKAINAQASTFEVGHNHLSDWTQQELYLEPIEIPEIADKHLETHRTLLHAAEGNDIGVNWVSKGGVTSVKN